ncbi:aminoglycoside 2'-N-acetyltransferase I [Amycolatopsis xylanica]|uniref:Aminoglycoside 2'-N-acetyltransferase I n=1 Tax=Amycolatopsis xylanica TaxID=589385 RepID=A0A1H3G986_9PSEU|nr:aminoglycoside 2'-N-acetyltransferase I [Amycolatopsis xylanica]
MIETVHTADLAPDVVERIRALLYEVFDDMTEDDWEHALGGLHALAWDGDDLIGHASVVQRRILHQGKALRAGYVEAVAVKEGKRRQGVAGALMAELERVIKSAYDLGALGASDEGAAFYAQRGWKPWQGKTFALTPTGVVATPEEDDCVFVLHDDMDLEGEITADWRDGDVW